ncbi:transposase domain-containing protein [Chelatococcus asaccharovorans]|uniref:transposase domain-containing protein n=1 Tax=Chelatococcus asaccharovorans TaxID=28210 RepID=UPI000D761B4F
MACRHSCPHRGHTDYQAGTTASLELDVADRQRSSCLTCGLHRRLTAYLTDVLSRIATGHLNTRLDDLLPWAHAAAPNL